MKTLSELLAVSLSITLVHAECNFRPYQLEFKTLMDESAFSASNARQDFLDALTSVGMVSITGIPSSRFKKQDVLSWDFHECAASAGVGQEYRFPDGTTRRTVATHTIPGPGGTRQVLRDGGATSSEACTVFSEASVEFRSVVAEVTEAFASRLTSMLKGSISTPLLVTKDGLHQFQSFSDVVANGEHLEHFHSYQRTVDSGMSETTDGTTIELHTDQGLFLVFAPGRLADANNGKSLQLSSGLHIQPVEDSDEVVEVEFSDSDDLVIMLGDGMNRVVNPKIKRNVNGATTALTLRATPHALFVPLQEQNNARLWYGRMVLPPALAQSDVASMTHGDVRNKIIHAAAMDNLESVETLSLGCSKAGVPARILNKVESCQENFLYCWHTCMSLLEFNVSEEICASRNLRLECINPRDQIYVEGHGDYFPGCTNSTQNATEFPKLPTYPRNDASCPEASWDEFSSGKGYNVTYEIIESIAKIHWNVLDGGNIEGKLDFNGLFGFLAFGFANETDNDLNGMLGSSVIMALPGGNFSPATGLNLSLGPEVKEYHIGMETAFRHWFKPVQSLGSSSYSVNVTDCFVSLLFKADSINGVPFNVTGSNSMIWAANPTDYFAGYHGNVTRSRIVLDWLAGTGSLFGGNQGESSTAVPDTMAASGIVNRFKISIQALLSFSLLVSLAISF